MATGYTRSDSVNKRKNELDDNSTYQESSEVTQARDAATQHAASQPAAWSGGTYGQALQDKLAELQNRKAFSYDLNGDALYQQYKNQYMNQGKLAMMDTLGQAQAATGGYGNSYASIAGNQAYQSYLSQLNDVVPELYQAAYSKYTQEGEDLQNQYSLLANQYNTEYGEYQDQLSQWNTEQNRLDTAYQNAADDDYNRFATERSYLADRYDTELTQEFNEYQQAYDEQQADQSEQLAAYKAQIEYIQAQESINSIEYNHETGKYEFGGAEYDSYGDAFDAAVSMYDIYEDEYYLNKLYDDFSTTFTIEDALSAARSIKVVNTTPDEYDPKYTIGRYQYGNTQYATYKDAVIAALEDFDLGEDEMIRVLKELNM